MKAEILQEISEIRADVAKLMEAHACETITVRQAAVICGFAEDVKRIEELMLTAKPKQLPALEAKLAKADKNMRTRVYLLLKRSGVIHYRPEAKMITINKLSLQKFLTKNEQHQPLKRIAA